MSRAKPVKAIQSVVEWRYRKAHRYWDDCGKVVSAIEAAFPGCQCQKLGEHGFEFLGRSHGIDIAHFFWDRASITQTDQGDAHLPEAAERFWQLLVQGLEPGDPLRLGHRTWMMIEFDSIRQAAKHLESRKPLITLSDGVDLGTLSAAGLVMKTALEPAGRQLRLSVDTGTLKFKHKAESREGVIIDADIFVEAPNPVPATPRQFIGENIELVNSRIVSMFR